MFSRWRSKGVCFSKKVTKKVEGKWFPRSTQIGQVELLAVVTAFDTFGAELSGKRVIALIDSEAALGAIVKGYSRKDDISDLVSVLWETIARYNIIVYFDRVSTDANISDGPSRDDWTLKFQCGWDTLRVQWAMGVE